ncbi:hypothetical protein BCR33DRAFT_724306 [Rhizoclosmatium globosum]|uniref:Large ribosomal subunit protein uL29m n=1 Tax=Rhizoclosmatium globosum TaxID=329046 RepID=A0A1Y2B728_9FUNG|nr:hypothetical protein BCR33DRAFT_724306 [Rhizoclosmatium globosum]|eukprot:ORY30486.1 hypothetical protein BCR33DRAFT_724306 [Rhizoclosmatium globosum]
MFAQRLLSRAAPFVTSIRTHVPIQSASAFNLPRFALYSTATAQSPLSEAAAPLQPLAPSSTQTTSLSETDADADADASKLADLPYPSLTPAYASSIVPAAGTKGLLDFFDSEKGWYWNDTDPKTGRGWTCAELRNKSFYDLHKLWWICIKEQNKLLSQKDEARMFKVIFPNGVRLQQVRMPFLEL